MNRNLFKIFLIVFLVSFLTQCFGGSGGDSDGGLPDDGIELDELTGIDSDLNDVGVATLPVTPAKLSALDHTKMTVTVEDASSTSLNADTSSAFLTTQGTCDVVYTITGIANTNQNPTLTPDLLIYNATQDHSDIYDAAFDQTDGRILSSVSAQVCGQRGDFIYLAGLTPDRTQATIPVAFEVDDEDNVMWTLTHSRNLAPEANKILVSSLGQIYVIVAGTTENTIYELQSDNSLGTIITTVTDIPVTLDIFTIDGTTYIYYFNEDGEFKELTISGTPASLMANLAFQSIVDDVTSATIFEAGAIDEENFEPVEPDGSFQITHQAQNDGNDSEIVNVRYTDENGDTVSNFYRRQKESLSGALSNAIVLSDSNASTYIQPDILGKTYIYLEDDPALGDCESGEGCIIATTTQGVGSFGAVDDEAEFTVDNDDILITLTGVAANPVTQLFTLPAEVDTDLPEQTDPNGLFLRNNGDAFFFDDEGNVTQLDDDFDNSDPLIRLYTKILEDEDDENGNNGKSLILGCRDIDGDLTPVYFSPGGTSSDELVERITAGTWEPLVSGDRFESCSATRDITIGDDLSVYFFRTDDDDNSQISTILFDQNTALQNAVIQIRPDNP